MPAGADNGATEVFPGCHHDGYLSPEDGDYHEVPLEKRGRQPGRDARAGAGRRGDFRLFYPAPLEPNRSQAAGAAALFELQRRSDGGQRRERHYDGFHGWLRNKYADTASRGLLPVTTVDNPYHPPQATERRLRGSRGLPWATTASAPAMCCSAPGHAGDLSRPNPRAGIDYRIFALRSPFGPQCIRRDQPGCHAGRRVGLFSRGHADRPAGHALEPCAGFVWAGSHLFCHGRLSPGWGRRLNRFAAFRPAGDHDASPRAERSIGRQHGGGGQMVQTPHQRGHVGLFGAGRSWVHVCFCWRRLYRRRAGLARRVVADWPGADVWPGAIGRDRRARPAGKYLAARRPWHPRPVARDGWLYAGRRCAHASFLDLCPGRFAVWPGGLGLGALQSARAGRTRLRRQDLPQHARPHDLSRPGRAGDRRCSRLAAFAGAGASRGHVPLRRRVGLVDRD